MSVTQGLLAQLTDLVASFAELTSQLLVANAGSNPSGGWVSTSSGATNGATPWGVRPNIDTAAQWVWHNSNGTSNPTRGGFNHDEYLIFRIAVDAKEVSEPAGLVLLGLGLLGLGAARRRQAK